MFTTQSSLLIRLRSTEDAEAWSRLVRLYTPLLLHWIKSLGIESHLRFDVCQDVFLVLLDRSTWLTSNRPTSFRNWLRTVTINKCRDLIRKQQRTTEAHSAEIIEASINDPSQLLTDREYSAFVAKQALQLMRDSFAETTWRACWESVVLERPASEIASELGITENAVYLARGRVLKRLREELAGLWD
ncbi:MAG: sigma-70 family RNA polymerase sigma factor [Pirellula sp.]|jgi:RNA polymerase sigma-70 factor (ECF subfamily)|nr:sigma-70 family RNA polymerase sigma factor [Pirellula sp.]